MVVPGPVVIVVIVVTAATAAVAPVAVAAVAAVGVVGGGASACTRRGLRAWRGGGGEGGGEGGGKGKGQSKSRDEICVQQRSWWCWWCWWFGGRGLLPKETKQRPRSSSSIGKILTW